MGSPALARQSVSADLSEFRHAELEALVATMERQRPSAWSRVEQLQQTCRLESPRWAAAYMALALGHRAVTAGHKVSFVTAADLMLQLAAAKVQVRLKEYFNRVVLGRSC